MKSPLSHSSRQKYLLGLGVFCFFLLIVAQSASAKLLKLGPAGNTVKTYCMVDSLGVNLTSDTWKYIQDLAVWEDGPGWDGATVIGNFEIVDEVYNKDGTAQVIVNYQVVGELGGGAVKNLNKAEKVTYKLINIGGIWKIQEPQLEPHILPHIAELFSSPVSSTK